MVKYNLTRLNLVRLSVILSIMKKPIFRNGGLYHVYNRGVEKRKIFMDDKDYLRFIHDLFEFNDTALASNLYYKKDLIQSYEIGTRKIELKKKKEAHRREFLINLLAFCLMPNHFHLLVRQRQ